MIKILRVVYFTVATTTMFLMISNDKPVARNDLLTEIPPLRRLDDKGEEEI